MELRGDEDNYGQSALVHLTARPQAAVVGGHLHPQLTERFRVISGRPGLEWPAKGVLSSASEVVAGLSG